MKTTHTPGPWQRVGLSVYAPDGTIPAITNILGNAELIAAAPELLYALEKIHANAAESPEWIRNVIDQVLAKARGEQ